MCQHSNDAAASQAMAAVQDILYKPRHKDCRGEIHRSRYKIADIRNNSTELITCPLHHPYQSNSPTSHLEQLLTKDARKHSNH